MSSSRLRKCRASFRSIGDEELEKILLKLSAFDLVRCKTVCKRFRLLISSRRFVSAHLNRSSSSDDPPQLLVRNGSYLFDDEPPPGPFKSVICLTSEAMCVVGSVNGLICLAGHKAGVGARQYTLSVTPDDIWILNPVTGFCRKLPSPSSESRITLDTVTVKYAFWWDADEDSDGGVYKVAKIVSGADGTTVLEVWVSSFPGIWTSVSSFHFQFDLSHHTWAHPCEVLIEGLAAYWIVFNPRGRTFVLSLDLKTLQLKWIPLSKSLMRGNACLLGGNLNGEFVLLEQQPKRQTEQQLRSSSFGNCMYHVWTMVVIDDNGSEAWKKSSKIFLDFPFQEFLGNANGKLVLKTFDNIFTLYDLEFTRTKQIFEKDSQLSTIRMRSAHGFIGSLVSIEGFKIENSDLLRSGIIHVAWPYSYPSGRVGKIT